MKIGFKNFKKFKDFPMIELAPITFLVGPNNSGKSSFIKALTLLLYNLNNQEKRGEKRRILLDDPFIEDVTFINNTLDNFDWGDFSTCLHHDSSEKAEEIVFEWSEANIHYQFAFGASSEELRLNPKLLLRMPVSKPSIENTLNNFKIEWVYMDASWHKVLSVKIEDFRQWLDNYIEWLGYRIMRRQGPIDSKSKEFQDLEFWDRFRNRSYRDRLEEELNRATLVREELSEITEEKIEVFIDKVEPNRFKSALLEYASYQITEISRRGERSVISDYVFINAHDASHNIALNVNDKNNYLAQAVAEFYSSGFSHQEYLNVNRWISDWLKKFGIGEGFEIQSHFGGETFTVDILKVASSQESVKVPLGTLGTGSIQLFILLLKIGSWMAKSEILNAHHSNTRYCRIIVEEPEQNLHPKLQSKLAELFLDVYEKTKGKIQFLVETHSEYLIRRTQVMVAKEHYSDEETLEKENPFKVYFFPAEGLPFDMGYKISGRFIKKFDYGFFDEATKWYLKILYYEQGGV